MNQWYNTRVLVSTSMPTSTPPPFVDHMCDVFMDTNLYQVLTILRCYVRPAVCLLGFSANTISLTVLRRNGLHKQANTLLLGLVVADSLYLISGMNFAEVVSALGSNNKDFPPNLSFQNFKALDYFLLTCDLAISNIGHWGLITSTIIPFLITGERLLAIYRPTTYKTLVTANRVKIVVICSFLVCLPWVLSASSFSVLVKVKLKNTVTLLALRIPASQCTHIPSVVGLYVISSTLSFINIAVVTLGCSIIWVKVQLTLTNRRKLTSPRSQHVRSLRTTRTLILACFMSAVTHGATSVCAIYTMEQSNLQMALRLADNSDTQPALQLASNPDSQYDLQSATNPMPQDSQQTLITEPRVDTVASTEPKNDLLSLPNLSSSVACSSHEDYFQCSDVFSCCCYRGLRCCQVQETEEFCCDLCACLCCLIVDCSNC
ncbi:G-protein coupled receptor [Biomphalaria glabrata]|nr:putative G-protein coupled receptor [Biomphalaria glabrata]